jgi:hypothetical protein
VKHPAMICQLVPDLHWCAMCVDFDAALTAADMCCHKHPTQLSTYQGYSVAFLV